MSFATCTIGVWSRPKRETSCFSSLTMTRVGEYHHAFFIYSLLDRLLVALHIKSIARQPWRTKISLLFVVTLLIPLRSGHTTCRSSLIAFGTGMMMLTYRSLIENHPYVIFMTSRNYCKDADGLVPNHSRKGRFGRVSCQAMNYGLSLGALLQELLA